MRKEPEIKYVHLTPTMLDQFEEAYKKGFDEGNQHGRTDVVTKASPYITENIYLKSVGMLQDPYAKFKDMVWREGWHDGIRAYAVTMDEIHAEMKKRDKVNIKWAK